ncbi:hypothetical protein CBR_g5671 [Chara braunii]|uniref:Sodium/solute symporter n=1 Tax=Chara braunii TaxID=69332 RepID=A0A388JRU6_CHABU|nr:hypothetical protein CBR_g5671 [Chara braunii]|eukprot:GBG60497.1 hypothetical protein CBR_g5671 [Chara braunii]
MSASLSAVDWLTIALYFIGVGIIGTTVSRREHGKQGSSGGGSATSYFLAERNVPFWAVAASLLASNIGAQHFVGLAGTAAYSGIAVGWYEWGAMPCVLALGYFFLPVYMSAGINTMPDWVGRRYNSYCKTFIVVLSLFLYIFTKISAALFAGQLIISELIDVNKFAATVALIVATALYTVTGGLAAVVYTETLQTVILLLGGCMMLAVGLQKVGGFGGLKSEINHNRNYFHLLRPASDPTFPWTGFIFGYYFVALWYWTTDQVIVQRALAARNIQHGRGGCVAGCYLKLLPGFIMVVPGMIARALMQRKGVVTKDSHQQVFDRAYPWLVVNVAPKHTKGLLIAATVAALMSSLASIFNSCATIFTMNIYKPFFPRASSKELVWTGRVVVVLTAVVSMLWLPLIPVFGEQLFLYTQKPPSYVAPPIFAVFLWGLLIPWVNGTGAQWGLTIGVSLGVIRFFFEVVHGWVGASRFLAALNSLNFLHFAACNMAVTTAIILLVSWRTSKGGHPLMAEAGDGTTATQGDSIRCVMWHKGLYEKLVNSDAKERSQAPYVNVNGARATSTDGEEMSSPSVHEEPSPKASPFQMVLDEAMTARNPNMLLLPAGVANSSLGDGGAVIMAHDEIQAVGKAQEVEFYSATSSRGSLLDRSDRRAASNSGDIAQPTTANGFEALSPTPTDDESEDTMGTGRFFFSFKMPLNRWIRLQQEPRKRMAAAVYAGKWSKDRFPDTIIDIAAICIFVGFLAVIITFH